MRASDRRVQPLQGLRAAFTLVEMLISVTLVLLMMTMFTSVFQMATESLSKQRSIAASDQKIRSMTTTLRADFAKRSARQVFPFLPGELASTTKFPFNGRPGYVYISCNDTASGQDDLIQFTVDSRQVQTNADTTKYAGRSALLFDRLADINLQSPNVSTLSKHLNQPEADDGALRPNTASASNAAEVSLFLRNGNLIRRVMLMRDPLAIAGGDLEVSPKSSEFNNPFFLTAGVYTAWTGPGGVFTFINVAGSNIDSDDFWKHFDFSAVPSTATNSPVGVTFVGIDALDNAGPITAISTGMPYFRFGFNPLTGLSREHSDTTANGIFFGRYLHAETSFFHRTPTQTFGFKWPIAPSVPENAVPPFVNGNPMDIANNPVSLDSTSGLVKGFDGTAGRGGDRRVEDVLQTGVQEFRIELWDDRLEKYVVPGHSVSKTLVSGTAVVIAGDYHLSRNAQFDGISGRITYGPLQVTSSNSGVPHVFDTWHPNVAAAGFAARRDFDGDGDPTDISEQHAPYYPLKYYPPQQQELLPVASRTSVRSGTIQLGPSSPVMPVPTQEFDPISGRSNANQGVWEPGATYFVGDVVFARESLAPTVRGWDSDGNGRFEWLEDRAFTPTVVPKQSVHWAYRCVGTVSGNPSGTSNSLTVPRWGSPGLRFPDTDDTLTNELIWEGFVNYQPLKSIRLTIRFIDESSQQPKQLSLIMPMADPE
jgi:type II secretory pathway pseudopilin PulG